MNNDNDPTPGALRAAIVLLEDPDLGEDPMVDIRKIAEIIDRETNLPELLNALESLEKLLSDKPLGSAELEVVAGARSLIQKARTKR